MRIDISRLRPRQKSYVIGFKRGLARARHELSQELRSARHQHVREVFALQQDLRKLTVKYETRLLVEAAIYERSQMAPDVRLH